MAQFKNKEKINIPSIQSFRTETLCKDQQYIIIGNFNYVPTETKGLITDADGLVLKPSGLSNEIFFEVMWDFTRRHAKKVVMFEEESFVIAGGLKTLDCLDLECGERFCYMLSTASEICDFCAHEKALIVANSEHRGHVDQAPTNHAFLDS